MSAFVFVWHPNTGPWESAGVLGPDSLHVSEGTTSRWSTGTRRQGIHPGDTAYLMAQGTRRGLIARGTVASEIHEAPHWDGSGRQTTYVAIAWESVMGPDSELPAAELADIAPSVPWMSMRGGGVNVPAVDEASVEEAWVAHVERGTLERQGWWRSMPSERFWLETTDRADIGVDLNAPQAAETGRDYWGYSLIKSVEPGDVILHYSKPAQGIVAWSRAVGRWYPDEVFWGARGMSARGMGVQPYYRPGWRLGLEGPFPLATPITLSDLRNNEATVRAVRSALPLRDGEPSYFSFELSEKRPLRPTQAYLTKFPAALVGALHGQFPEAALPDSDAAAMPEQDTPAPTPPRNLQVTTRYRPAAEDTATSPRKPFDVDPSEVDRALRGHARTQNALAQFVSESGLTPLSPGPNQPQFDLAWLGPDSILRVAEVKSLTRANEERQLRLAIGQVLRYAHLLSQTGAEVIPIVVPQREPRDASWLDLCETLSVKVAWPGRWDRVP